MKELLQSKAYIFSSYQIQQTQFLMQVLLPDFAFHQPLEIGTPFKNSRKNNLTARARTSQTRRKNISTISISSISKTLKSSDQLTKKNLSLCIQPPSSKSNNPDLQFYSSRQFATVDFSNNMHDSPIHSRKTHRFYSQTITRKSKSQKKHIFQRPNEQVLPSFSFLITKKVPKMEEQQLKSDINLIQTPVQQYRKFGKFPTKKVKTPFLKDDYRPWSPNKAEFTYDELSS